MQRQNLIDERKRKQLTQAEAAEIVGITTRHYNSLEAGTSDGSVKVWERLKDLFGKPIDYLLKQAETSPKEYHNKG